MLIVKRDGTKEPIKLEKISKRLTNLSKDLKQINPIIIAQKVIQGVYDGVSSRELDKLAIETSYGMSASHIDYDTLATRLLVSTLHKETVSTFSEAVKILSEQPRNNLSPQFIKIVKKNAKVLDAAIQHSRDYLFDYFGFKTLERGYLLRKFNADNSTTIIERPQYMWMRVALEIHGSNIQDALNTYTQLSTKQFTHATPTLFNSGLRKNQQSSCFLIAMKDDSITGIYDTVKEVALISQSAGGIGIHIHNIRAKGSPIAGTGGTSNGIVPMLKVFCETARYVDQCFTPDTIVQTSSGPKSIGELSDSDKVQTTEGDSSFIKKEFDYAGDLVTIETTDGCVRCTPEHLFLCIKSMKNISRDLLQEKLKRGLVKPEWVCAKDISTNDLLLKLK